MLGQAASWALSGTLEDWKALHLAQGCRPVWKSDQQRLHTNAASPGPPAFVFDIDGVLIRGKNVLECAKKTLWRLYKNDGSNSDPTLALLHTDF